MIRIGKPYIKENGDRTELHAPVSISSDTVERYLGENAKLPNVAWLTECDYPPASWEEDGASLWFSVPAEYGKYLCTERSNAFVIAMFWYAMVTGSDIEFEAPLSKKIYDGITAKLIPALVTGEYGSIRLSGPVTDEPVWNEGAVVTGASCGADSTYAIHTYGCEDAPEGMRLTHLVYCHADYLFRHVEPPYDIDELIAEQERKYSSHAAAGAKTVAEHYGLPLLEIMTNFDRDYYRGGLVYTGMYRFFACVISLEHLFRLYIFASSGNGPEAEEASLFLPHYEDLLCDCLSSESFRFMLSDRAERFDKIKAIADDPVFQKVVSTCSNDTDSGRNCGECYGCWKTMVPLDMLGKLDKYGERYDLDKYYRNRKEIFEEMISFSMRPESVTPRKAVASMLRHADECGETGRIFRETYEWKKKQITD